jgi:NAD(P)-dependent dehydrogenase (short-subunit alcohol dehydrogenase family)
MTPDHGLDRVLDRAVLPGYSSIGYAVRRRGWPDDDPRLEALVGKRALVTGAGGGLGEATALRLARLGATVHVLVRSAERAAPALDRITRALEAEERAADLHVEECDVSDLASVRRFAESFTGRLRREGHSLDVVVHNAGVMPPVRTASVDGHELTVATHVLGPVLMTELLLPVLGRHARRARVVLVSSGGMYTQPLPADDIEYERSGYRGSVAYARSKRIQVELTPLLADRWEPDEVAVYAMHPGWADTPGVASSLPVFRAIARPFLRTPEAGADTAVWLASTELAPPSGTFWMDRRQRPTSYLARTRPSPDEVARVWDWVRDATGLT